MSRFVAINLAGVSPPDIILAGCRRQTSLEKDLQWQSH
jgi:hypothetical protein